jgi:3-oxoacyl-[acyl-carrier-protein] synthase-3
MNQTAPHSRPVYIRGSGAFLPGSPIPFSDIGKTLGELDEAPEKLRKWVRRTETVMAELLDIDYVHYGIDPESGDFNEDNVSMAVKAARRALEAAHLRADEIDLICYGSAHQDQMPTASTLIQEALGIEVCEELSIHSNCTSAYKALYLGHQLIRSGQNRNVLVLSANMASSELRAGYYNQQLVDKESLFLRWFLCDGAGALVLSSDPLDSRHFIVETTFIESIGGSRPSLMFNRRPAYWMNPVEEFNQGRHHLRQRFANALSTSMFQEPDGSIFFKGFRRMMRRSRVSLDAIKIFQVNLPAKHIVDSIVEEFEVAGVPRSTFYSKLNQLGYCGPPMVFICLDKILREEALDPGDCVASFVTEVSKFMQAGYVLRYDNI